MEQCTCIFEALPDTKAMSRDGFELLLYSDSQINVLPTAQPYGTMVALCGSVRPSLWSSLKLQPSLKLLFWKHHPAVRQYQVLLKRTHIGFTHQDILTTWCLACCMALSLLQGCSGGAMVLGKLPDPGRPTNLANSSARS